MNPLRPAEVLSCGNGGGALAGSGGKEKGMVVFSPCRGPRRDPPWLPGAAGRKNKCH